MTADFINARLTKTFEDNDIIVFKGFPVSLLQNLENQSFLFLDKDIVSGERINLDKINSSVLLMRLMNLGDNKSYMTYESFLSLTSNFRNVSVIGKMFCVVTNNLLGRYENQASIDIPDFDSSEFQKVNDNNIYSLFYSYCYHDNRHQYIQYIEPCIDDEINISKLDLIPSHELDFAISEKLSDVKNYLPSSDNSIDELLDCLFYDMALPHSEYVIESKDVDNEKIRVIGCAAKMMDIPLSFVVESQTDNIKCRKELLTLMNRVWGYESFRNLKIYKDLYKNKESKLISQGDIVEYVVRQAEYARYDLPKMKNVLLTSPTGVGKSLLFQLSAIYLAEKYELLTIIVSPLVALMCDQVENLKDKYRAVESINGNLSATEKDRVVSEVKSGKINILYLAPELLLSYSVDSFIGQRKIGLFVVDEAHTVTTWGRDFRVDYWFLGDYIRTVKRVLGYSFPIFALTATAVWDPNGKNDMVFDTIRSLNMNPCEKYIGVVKRDNISFDISASGFLSSNYEKQRTDLTVRRINEFCNEKTKTIVYFPYKKTIDDILQNENIEHRNLLAAYHSGLTTSDKKNSAQSFKDGTRYVMCATKAYGMGVDVTDIQMVYHHAPTGSLSDYVQEIGRLARDPQIVGIAKIDFSSKDFKYTHTLHGLSSIRPYQLRAVLKKLMALYKLNGERRNMLVSASDFEHVFVGKDVDYDQKIKSCLMLLSNDLRDKLGFYSIIVRPKSLFTKTYIEVKGKDVPDFTCEYKNYISEIKGFTKVFILDSDELWKTKYSNISFPSFKRELAKGNIIKNTNVQIVNRISVTLSSDVNKIRSSLLQFFNFSTTFLDKMTVNHKRMSVCDMKKSLPAFYTDAQKECFVESFKLSFASSRAVNGTITSCCTIYNFGEKSESFQANSGYDRIVSSYLQTFNNYIDDTQKVFYCKSDDCIVRLAELMNSLDLAEYEIRGGDNPSIFVRINNPLYLNNLVRYNNYENKILKDVYSKHEFSERIIDYFFTHKMTDEQRWNFIEDYFLGASEEQLLSDYES